MKFILTVIFLFFSIQIQISSNFININKLNPEELIKDYQENPEENSNSSLLIDNIKELNIIDDYGECRFSILRTVLAFERQNKFTPLKFDTPSEFCPHITNSCCSKREIKIMAKKIYLNIPRTRYLYQRINQTLMLFKQKGEFILDFLKENRYKDHAQCTNISNRDVYKTFLNFIDSFEDRTEGIDNFVDDFIDFQSGIICSLCDQEFNHLFFKRVKGRKVLNWGQCHELYRSYFFFLDVAVNLYRIASVVRTIECSIYDKVDFTTDVNFQVLIDRYVTTSRCFDLQDIPGDENNHECLLLCKDLSKINVFDDSESLGLFNLVEYILQFYDRFIYNIQASTLKLVEARNKIGVVEKIESEDSEEVEEKLITEETVNRDEDEGIEDIKSMQIKYRLYPTSKDFMRSENIMFYVDKFDGLYPSYYKMDFSSFKEYVGIFNNLAGVLLFIGYFF